jgi:S1-C subfamily serine protease
MFESTRQSSNEPEHLVTQASYADVPDFQFSRAITQTAFTPATARNDAPASDTLSALSSGGGVVDIRTLYLGNNNMETHGWYAANSRRAQLVKDIGPSSGRIHVTTPGTNHEDWASGFVLTDDGIMYTDRHAVINPNDQVEVTINGEKHNARVIADDQKKDTALLQIIPNHEGEKFKPVHLEGSSQIAVGTPLLSAGFAKRSDNFSISPGTYIGDSTLGQLARDMKNGLPQGQDLNQQFKVVEANIQAGNSGELVVNEQTGGVVGAIGLALPGKDGFVITSEDIQDLLSRIRQNRQAQAQPQPTDTGTGVGSVVDRMFGQTPAPQGAPYYGNRETGSKQQSADHGWDWWSSKIKNFSFRDLFG